MRYLTELALLVALPLAQLVAQTAPPAHHHPADAVIDGAAHPELISDAVAYRLYLVTVSKPPNPTVAEQKLQAAQLDKIGLAGNDRQAHIDILANFKTQYQSMIEAFNVQAAAAWARGERIDQSIIRLQRERLVQSTHDTLKATLTTDGWSRLDAYVQNEKRRMRISAGGTGQ